MFEGFNDTRCIWLIQTILLQVRLCTVVVVTGKESGHFTLLQSKLRSISHAKTSSNASSPYPMVSRKAPVFASNTFVNYSSSGSRRRVRTNHWTLGASRSRFVCGVLVTVRADHSGARAVQKGRGSDHEL